MSTIIRFLKPLSFVVYACFVLGGVGRAQSAVTDSMTDTVSVIEKFVSIGSHSLFVRIRGREDARYTVVFESGGGAIIAWTVQELLSSVK